MNEDAEPHILVIEVEGEDYSIEHLPTCPKVIESDDSGFPGDGLPVDRYDCRLQAVVDGNGIDDIENWQELKPGKYKIKSYYEYYPGEFGGSYGAEHEIGIFLDQD